MCRLALRPWLASEAEHWTERARRFHLFRKAASHCLLGCVAVAVICRMDYFRKEVSTAVVLWSVFLGCIVSAYWIARIHQPRMTLKAYVTQTFWTVGVMFALIAPIVWVILATSPDLVEGDWLRIGVAFLVFFVIHTGVWLLIMPGRDKHSATPRLVALATEVSRQSEMKPVRAWVIESFAANAFALFYLRSVVVTSRAMEVLDDDELRTILRHEMAHLRESLPVRAVRFIGIMPVFALAFIKPAVHHYHAVGLFVVCGGILLSRRLISLVARKMEERADRMSVTADGDGPVYARALEKLYEANRMPAVLRGRQIHPHLYDRMVAAGVTPDYPRPEPPERFHWSAVIGIAPFIWLGIRIGDWVNHYLR